MTKTIPPKNISHFSSEYDDVTEELASQVDQNFQIHQFSHEISAFNGENEIQVARVSDKITFR